VRTWVIHVRYRMMMIVRVGWRRVRNGMVCIVSSTPRFVNQGRPINAGATFQMCTTLWTRSG
jgi:hypothetical protein